MAELLNNQFKSQFTVEDMSNMPVEPVSSVPVMPDMGNSTWEEAKMENLKNNYIQFYYMFSIHNILYLLEKKTACF